MTATRLAGGSSAGPRPAASTASIVTLVAQREVMSRLRSKSFVISTAILLAAVVIGIVVAGLVGGSDSKPRIAVVGSASTVASSELFDVTDAAGVDEAEQLVRSGDVDAAVVPSDAGSASPVEVIALDQTPGEVVQLLSIAPEVQLLEQPAQNAGAVYLVALGFGLIFFVSAITFGSAIAQSVVEEKQTRIVEILLSTVSSTKLLAGKVIGNTILAFGQIALLSGASLLALMATGQDALLGTLSAPVLWFVLFFALGFVLLASLFAAAASLVSRAEDVGSTTTPVTMLVMIPYFLVIFFNSDQTVLAIMSYVPFSAPVGMPMRLFLGTAQWWEPLVSLAILIASTVLVLAIGSRIYRNSLLRTGGRVKLGDALRAR
jgi:ABC-2 type transport system permease protein